jgi:hypothetical protein
MDQYVLDTFVTATRTRDAVRQIRSIAVSARDRKYTLAAWFREHKRAAPEADQKRQAYDDLLGAAVNKAMRG